MIHQPSDNIIPRSRNRLQRTQHTPQTHRLGLHHRLFQHDHHRLQPPQHIRRPMPHRLVRPRRPNPEIRPYRQTLRVRGTPVLDEHGRGGTHAFPEVREGVVRREEPHASLHAHRGREDGLRRRTAVHVERHPLEVDEFLVVRHPLELAEPSGLGDGEDGLPVDVGPEHAGDEAVGDAVEELLVVGERGDVECAGADGGGCVAEESDGVLC